jgi:cell division protein FtsQ
VRKTGRGRPQPKADVVALPAATGRARSAQLPGSRFLPSGCSLALGFLLIGVGIAAYAGARETSVFAVQRIEVEGARPTTTARIEHALEPLRGKSLVGFDTEAARRRLIAISEVSTASFDRAFPHTLRIRVSLERAVAVLRQGRDAWLVSSSARVLRPLARPYPGLPRIWLPRSVDVAPNDTLPVAQAAAVQTVAPLHALRFPRVRSVISTSGELTLVLARGTEVRLGTGGDLRLKLAIAARILPLVGAASYIDVSVPERPVASPDSQVASKG